MKTSLSEPRKNLLKFLMFFIICIIVCSRLSSLSKATLIFEILLYVVYIGSGIIYYYRTFLSKDDSIKHFINTLTCLGMLWVMALLVLLITISDDASQGNNAEFGAPMAVFFIAGAVSCGTLAICEDILPRSNPKD